MLRSERVNQFYNSLTLLGEYYNRCRINNAPVSVLGCALFELLVKQLETVTQKAIDDPSYTIDEEFAKLVLTQITLNGLLAQPTHKTEIDAVLFSIRKCLIEVSQLTANIKALFLMTLDLYYSKFANIGKDLESMYAKFLVDDSAVTEAESNRNAPASTTEVNSLNKLRTELSGLGRGRNRQEMNRINNEYIGRPLKASERLIYAQQQAQTLRNKDETEEILQEKLFEKEMHDRNNENLKIVEQQASSEHQPANDDNSQPTQPSPTAATSTTTKTKSTKERKEDQAYFLVKPSSVRQRLKAPEQPPPQQPAPVIGLTDWYAEVESSAQNQTVSPSSVSSDSTKRMQNGFHSNASNPTSPNEIRRNNSMNHSFRSIRSDYSTRSMDRVGNPRYDKYDNKRHYNRGYYNHNNGGNYNNNFQNNRNNYQHGRDHGQNHGQYNDQQQNQNRYPNRRQNSDKGQNYSNKNNKNDNRGGNRSGGGGGGGGGGYNNYQNNRSYPSKSYGNRNRRQSYQHDDRSITPKPFDGENWDDN